MMAGGVQAWLLFLNGALGYLLKNTDRETLITAIKAVSKRDCMPTNYKDMYEKIEDFRHTLVRSSSKYALTPREKDILKLIVNGYNNYEIAEQLHISFRTVQNYRFNLNIKLEAKNNIELMKRTIELGLDK